MKSYLINNYRMSDYEKTKWDDGSFTDASFNDLFNKDHRNMVDANSFVSAFIQGFPLEAVDVDANFPKSNIELDSNTDEVRYNLSIVNAPTIHDGTLPLIFNKDDTEGFDTFVIKFNKLNKTFLQEINTIQITFTDTDLGSAPLVWESNDMTPHGSPLSNVDINLAFNANTIDNKTLINYEEGLIYISPEYLATLGLLDRAAASTGKIYHKHAFITFNTKTTLDYISISNITATNAIEVELENDVQIKYKSLTREKKNNQGKKFKDKYNTQKMTSYTIPLLTNEEERVFDKNFFRTAIDYSFYIFPFSDYNAVSLSNDVIENFKYGGHYWLDSDYTPERNEADLYEIKFKVEEVI